MEHRDVVFGLLVPADQHAPEPVDPAVRPLHHPPPRLEPRLLLDLLRLLAARPDVRREPELQDRLTHGLVVVPLVHAHPLRPGPRRPWPLDGDARKRGL